MRRVSRRVLVFWIVSMVLAGLAGAWLHHTLTPQTTEERIRREAERLQERVREMTR